MRYRELREASTMHQALALDSPAFRQWFGNSKVRDRAGRPLVVYHGTARPFEAFDVARIGDVFNDDQEGFFFTNNTGSDMASGYAVRAARMNQDEGANVVPVFVKIENPYTFAEYAYAYEYGDLTKANETEIINSILDGRGLVPFFDRYKHAIVADALRDGHDGILLYDPTTDIGSGIPENIVVVFRPDQIKSIFNRGTWDNQSAKLSEMIRESSDAERQSIVDNTEDEYRLPNLAQIVPPEHMHPVVKLGFPSVTIYRAVPDGVDAIRPGDWVALDQRYAAIHSRGGSVISRRVPAIDVAWAGTDRNEYYYAPRRAPQ